METPAEIEFLGMDHDAGAQGEIDRHIAQLEKRFGRITSCRVAVRAPSEHHKQGAYAVTIFMALPGHRDVNVDHVSKDSQRATELKTALNDAFKRARRQLQDRVRRMERQVK